MHCPRHLYTPEFDADIFGKHVSRWQELSHVSRETSQLIEESPWTYYQAHEEHLTDEQRGQLRTVLATLTPCDQVFIMQCSGMEVARRAGKDGDEVVALASLRAMRSLEFACERFMRVDASGLPETAARRVGLMLSKAIFKVQPAAPVAAAANVEGM